jgi:hypothetical protein
MRVTDIPSMGAQSIGPQLRAYAAQVTDGQSIVEVGAWLGAGTAYMALGIQDSGQDVHIHVYDRFTASESERRKAKQQGWVIRGDTSKLVKKSLKDLGLMSYVTLYKGSVSSQVWDGGPIGMFVLDTCKREKAFLSVIQKYAPSWIPGETIVVLMDYWYFQHNNSPGLEFQYEWMQKNNAHFRPLTLNMVKSTSIAKSTSGEASCASFVYIGGQVW